MNHNNPDARQYFMDEPNTASSPRSGLVPMDNDRDGLFDEDKYDDEQRRYNKHYAQGKPLSAPITLIQRIPADALAAPEERGNMKCSGRRVSIMTATAR